MHRVSALLKRLNFCASVLLLTLICVLGLVLTLPKPEIVKAEPRDLPASFYNGCLSQAQVLRLARSSDKLQTTRRRSSIFVENWAPVQPPHLSRRPVETLAGLSGAKIHSIRGS